MGRETHTAGDGQAVRDGEGACPRDDTTILDRGDVFRQRRADRSNVSAGHISCMRRSARRARSRSFSDGGYTVWTHSQGVYPLRDALAEMLRVPKERIRCMHVEGSGCYGHNGADDVAADAVLLARAMPGRPVRVQWMREDEHAWEPFGPPMIDTLPARARCVGHRRRMAVRRVEQHAFDATGQGGQPARRNASVSSRSRHRRRSPFRSRKAVATATRFLSTHSANARVVHHFIPDMPLRVSALRSLGAYANVFALESFVDELALAAKLDPLEFRLRPSG